MLLVTHQYRTFNATNRNQELNSLVNWTAFQLTRFVFYRGIETCKKSIPIVATLSLSLSSKIETSKLWMKASKSFFFNQTVNVSCTNVKEWKPVRMSKTWRVYKSFLHLAPCRKRWWMTEDGGWYAYHWLVACMHACSFLAQERSNFPPIHFS